MSHLSTQKRTDSRSNHPLARKPSVASHCNHLTSKLPPLMAVTAKKSWRVLPEGLLNCLTGPRQLPLLRWRNGIRFLAVVNHTLLENPM